MCLAGDSCGPCTRVEKKGHGRDALRPWTFVGNWSIVRRLRDSREGLRYLLAANLLCFPCWVADACGSCDGTMIVRGGDPDGRATVERRLLGGRKPERCSKQRYLEPSDSHSSTFPWGQLGLSSVLPTSSQNAWTQHGHRFHQQRIHSIPLMAKSHTPIGTLNPNPASPSPLSARLLHPEVKSANSRSHHVQNTKHAIALPYLSV